ncbi:AAA family ATPase [Halarcobacter sp.]|uniref:AAA family ATPase n=1 Tax=Halarcobacter sp. TaxID=2321133 RepID=UPI0029F58EEF|nr:AAA family ATPase [Halarcobacter sp.]
MKLIYLKIQKYKNIEDIELVFDQNHEVTLLHMEDKKDSKKKAFYLEIKNKEKQDSEKLNIFDCNVSFNAIVGENGTGKTNVLETICNLNQEKLSEDNLIFKVYKKDDIYYYLINDNDKTLYIHSSSDSIKEEKIKPFEELSSYSTIFYSEIPTKNVIEYRQLKNISFWKEVQKVQLKYIKKHINNNFNKESVLYLDEDYDFNSEIEEVSLNYSINKVKSEMQLNQLYLEHELKYYPNIEKKINKVLFEVTHEKFAQVDIHNVEEVTSCIISIVFSEYIDESLLKYDKDSLKENKQTLLGLKDFLDENLNIGLEEERKINFQDIRKEIKSITYTDLIDYEFLNNKLKDIKLFEDEYTKFIERIENDIDIEDDNESLIIAKKRFCTKKFIESLFPFIKYGIFNLKWELELSTGEESLMYFFSRLFQTFRKNPSIKNYIIVVDEIEAYLHPNWQKNFIKSINDFLKLKEFEDYNFNIIMTTHSPFVLSDLEDKDIIYLEKNENGYSKNSSNEIVIDTFGSNIHELLSHSFFMDDELPIGTFAKSKIEEVIKLLNKNSELIQEEHLLCIKIISIIGEPVLQERLWSMYHSKIKNSESKSKSNLLEIKEYLEKQTK